MINYNDYRQEDLTDPDRLLVRPIDMKKHSDLSFCKWAAGDWEARFYAFTETHDRERERHLQQLMNSPVWFKYKPSKVDKRAAVANNKARGGQKRQRRER